MTTTQNTTTARIAFLMDTISKLNAQADRLDALAKTSDHAAAIRVNARETRRSARQFATDLEKLVGA